MKFEDLKIGMKDSITKQLQKRMSSYIPELHLM